MVPEVKKNLKYKVSSSSAYGPHISVTALLSLLFPLRYGNVLFNLGLYIVIAEAVRLINASIAVCSIGSL